MDPITQLEKLVVSIDDVLNTVERLKTDLGFEGSNISCEFAKYIANTVCTSNIDILGIIPKLQAARESIVSFVKEKQSQPSADAESPPAPLPSSQQIAAGSRRRRRRSSRHPKKHLKTRRRSS
jgi:hypothetical protein